MIVYLFLLLVKLDVKVLRVIEKLWLADVAGIAVVDRKRPWTQFYECLNEVKRLKGPLGVTVRQLYENVFLASYGLCGYVVP